MFDRVALVRRLADECGQITLVGASTPDPWLALVVNGCSRACACRSNINGTQGRLTVSAPSEYATLCAQLQSYL